MRIDLAFPLGLDASSGGTRLASYADHVRDLIEQVLFTNPGERVNRPDFGAGLMRAVFMSESDQALATVRSVVQSNLQRWLAQVIAVDAVTILADDAALVVTVSYRVLATGERRTDRFSP